MDVACLMQLPSMPEASFTDNDKHELGASLFGNSQEVAEHYSWYTSSNDSSKASKPIRESIRRYLIMGYFLCDFFFLKWISVENLDCDCVIETVIVYT